ncbi:acyltransferase family protein [Phytoactinopolyspora limicola]|uniref:acyltransferase family protein n=1 Tax=Phytoactinopolyspora limicola TaxID=2715536 RepID=UPI00140E290A|nr:acyltransferase [Phytoactinopolyspora limicola]
MDVRTAAEQTPTDRNRHVDLLRASAITVVVIGHWLAAVVIVDNGVDGQNALSYLSWSHPVTWILQVMPLFFLVGGFSNGMSLTSHYQRGGDNAGWLLSRSARLLRPATTFLVLLAAFGTTARLLGADPSDVALAVWAASIPLWFLAAYSALVFLAPFLYAAHRRFGLGFPAAVAVVVLVLDVARLQFDVPLVGGANYLLVWLVFHQIGFAWQDGTITVRPAALAASAVAGLALLIALTSIGPYPVSMVGVPGEDLQNTAPPTFALVVLGLTQAAVALLLERPANRFLQRRGPWTAVVAVNAVVLTMFLWHMGAAVVSAVALYPTGIMPEPAVGSGEWLLLRLPWVVFCAAVLTVFIVLFARIEAKTTGTSKGRAVGRGEVVSGLRLPGWAWQAMTGLGIAGVLGGLLIVANSGRSDEHVTGLAPLALVAYLTGAGLLRLARYRHTTTSHPGDR